MVAEALRADGWYLRSDVIYSKPNPMPESVTDRPTKSHEYVFLLTKSARYFYDHEAIKERAEGATVHDLTGQGYSAPGQSRQTGNRKSEVVGANGRNVQATNDESVRRDQIGGTFNNNPRLRLTDGTRNRRSVWTITTQPYPEAHFATFPEELPETCIKAGTSEHGACSSCGAPYERVVEKGAELIDQKIRGGCNADGQYHGAATKAYEGTGAQNPSDVKRRILEGMVEKRTVGWVATCACEGAAVVPCVVLDPFNGAGTTGLVADRLGRDYIGIELNPVYLELARKRIGGVTPLFDAEVPA